MNEEIIDQVYNILVERFNIGEVFLSKYGKTRPNNILWSDFINTVLSSTTAEDIIKFCRYSNSANFSNAIKKNYPKIFIVKNGRIWPNFLLSLIDCKRCTKCGIIKPYKDFAKDTIQKDYLSCECHLCGGIRNKNYHSSNPDKRKEYYIANKKDYIARKAKYRAFKLQATPNWANLITIREIYRTCPPGYHVDHIVPLKGKLVCGLHCEFNLQHLPASENLSKGNRFEV